MFLLHTNIYMFVNNVLNGLSRSTIITLVITILSTPYTENKCGWSCRKGLSDEHRYSLISKCDRFEF